LNRRAQDTFECISPDCDFKANADDVSSTQSISKIHQQR